MQILLEFVKVLALGVVVLFLLLIAFAIIEGTINYIKERKRKRNK